MKLGVSTAITITFLKLLATAMALGCVGSYLVKLTYFLLPDFVLIGLFWVPIMINFMRGLHLDPDLIKTVIYCLIGLIVFNVASTAVMYVVENAFTTSVVYSLALTIVDIVLAGILAGVLRVIEHRGH